MPSSSLWKPACLVSTAALIVSLGVRLVTQPSFSPAAPAATASTLAPARPTPPRLSDEACVRELGACRREGWTVVLDAIASDARGRRDQPPRAPAAIDAGLAGGASSAEQGRALDEIAREHLRRHWVDKKEEILRSIRDVGTEAWTKTEIAKTLDKLGPALDLDVVEHSRVEEGYGALWARHGSAFQGALAPDAPDVRMLLEQAKSFFRDEDELVKSAVDARRAAQYRAMELKSRTAILAILAALADEPWDSGIVW